MRLNALVVIHRHLTALASKLPLSSNFQQAPPELEKAIIRLWGENPEFAETLARQYSDEPWRQYVLLLQAKLPLSVGVGNKPTAVEEAKHHYRTPDELDEDLALLSDSLVKVGAKRLANTAVWPVRRALDIFGFHLASLDIRQNSKFHDQALIQILAAIGQPAPDFGEWTRSAASSFSPGNSSRRARSFTSTRHRRTGRRGPFVLRRPQGISEELRPRRPWLAHRQHDAAVLGPARRVCPRPRGRVDEVDSRGLLCELPVVPLFETLDDLEHSAGLIDRFLAHPITQRSLAHHQVDRTKVLSLPHSTRSSRS